MNQIAFSIEKEETESTGLLTIRLVYIERKSESTDFVNTSWTLGKWRSLALDVKQKQLIDYLAVQEQSYQSKLTGKAHPILSDTSSLILVHVSPKEVLSFFEQASIAQSLYFQGKQLVADLFGRASLYYACTASGEDLIVNTHLKWRDQDIPLQQCNCIGPGQPLWFIRGIQLKLIETDSAWKDFLSAYKNENRVLKNVEKAAFLESGDPEDSLAPKIIFKDGSLISEIVSLNPLPLLILKDKTGAFADLWMDYGSDHKIAYHETQVLLTIHLSKPLKRNLEAEKGWERDLLETDFIKKIVSGTHYYCPLDKVAKSLTFLLELGWSIHDSKGRRLFRETQKEIQFFDDDKQVKIYGKVTYENFQTDLSTVIGGFNRRERFIQIGENAIGLLPDSEDPLLKEAALEGELVGDSIHIKKNRFGSIASLVDAAVLPDSLKFFLDKDKDLSPLTETLPSDLFIGKLRSYQQEGVNWISFLKANGLNGILADDMGLGKTIQVLAFLSLLPSASPHLIVVPTSLIFNWKNEIHRFLPSFSVYLHQGSQRITDVEQLKKFSIILTSYTLLRLDQALLSQLTYHCIILDEAQIIKNANTLTSQAACRLEGSFRLSITGTPIENHLNEMWSQFRFLMPDLFGTKEAFEADIQAALSDRRYLERIKRKISPFLLRRTKSEVAKDLPERVDQITWITMNEDQRALYESFIAGYRSSLLKKIDLDGIGKHRMEILEALLRLRQLCCHPILISSLLDEDSISSSAKTDLLLDDLETLVEEKHKVLIYSQFTTLLKWLLNEAKKRGWNTNYLDGSTMNREEVVNRFQNDPDQLLFFISLKAGGVGLNLTAADHVYICDPWWNDAAEEQAINRAHRIGRQRSVHTKRLIVAESIEEKMLKLKMSKRVMIEDLLSQEMTLQQMTMEDLRFLFS